MNRVMLVCSSFWMTGALLRNFRVRRDAPFPIELMPR